MQLGIRLIYANFLCDESDKYFIGILVNILVHFCMYN